MTLDDSLRAALVEKSLDGKLKNVLSITEQSIQFVPASKPYENEAKMLKSKYIYINATTSAVSTPLNGSVNGEHQGKNGARHLPHRPNGRSSGDPANAYCTDVTIQTSGPQVPPPQFQIFPADAIRLFWDDGLRMSTGVGLHNLGNTCFLNSVLQVLVNTPPLVNYLYSEDHANQACPSKTGYCAICALRHHIKRVHDAAKSRQDSLSPHFIVQKLRCVMKSHSAGRQQDAHEFLRYFVDSMQNASIFLFKDKKLDLFTKETSAIGRIFGGFHKNDVTCLCCKSVSTTFDPFLDISLEIKQFTNIENSLKHFTRVETLSSDNAYKCPKCNKKVSAHKNYTINVPPNVLTLQLKRFDHFGKIDKTVGFPEKLNIRPYMSQKQGLPVNYKLYGVVVHAGRSTNSGHYYAFVKNPFDQWHLMDDSRVCAVPAKNVLQTAAYILFYVRLPLQIATVKPQPKITLQPTAKPNDAGENKSVEGVPPAASPTSKRSESPPLLSPSEFLKTFCSPKVKNCENTKNGNSVNSIFSTTTDEHRKKRAKNNCDDKDKAGEPNATTNGADGKMFAGGAASMAPKLLKNSAFLSPLEFLKSFCTPKVKSWENVKNGDATNSIYSTTTDEHNKKRDRSDYDDEYDVGKEESMAWTLKHNDKRSTPAANENFHTLTSSSVLSRRNFGLTRGRSLQESIEKIHQMCEFEANQAKQHSDIAEELPETGDDSHFPARDVGPTHSKHPPVVFGEGGFGDKSASEWNWPLGEVRLKNEEHGFRVCLEFGPFEAHEVTANVVGNDLLISCESEELRKPGVCKRFSRCYQLPLNVDPGSVVFRTNKKQKTLLIEGQKFSPIKLALCGAPLNLTKDRRTSI